MDKSGLRERVANEIAKVVEWSSDAVANDAVDAILALVDAEYRPLVKAAKSTLAILECGVDPGPHHMGNLDGRAAWINRMTPVREQLRAALASMKEEL